MKLHMDKTLRFWVNCSYEDKKYKKANRTRAELTAEILREYERHGDAMRYLNAKGNIVWKASPVCFRNWPTPNVRSKMIWRICREGFGDRSGD